MTASPAFSAAWLGLREAADGQARAADLVADLAADLVADLAADLPADVPQHVIHDLGCGTGSMGRWLAPRLPGAQRWILHDRDPDLLAHAAARMPGSAADGAAVTVQVRQGDVTSLVASDFAGARLVTTSALLDLLTEPEVAGLAEACVGAGCSALLTLSVAGRVELTPKDPLDAEIAAAFDAHQRRAVDGRRLLGPDSAAAAAAAFTRLGADVQLRPSPWRLGPDQAALAVGWLQGWVDAAVEQRPELRVQDYLSRRSEAAAAGRLRVVVEHVDLLAKCR